MGKKTNKTNKRKKEKRKAGSPSPLWLRSEPVTKNRPTALASRLAPC